MKTKKYLIVYIALKMFVLTLFIMISFNQVAKKLFSIEQRQIGIEYKLDSAFKFLLKPYGPN